MDWSSNINNKFQSIYNSYLDIKTGSGENSAKEKEIKKLFESETKNEKFDYNDLIQLSGKKDADGSGQVDENETSFFNDMKSFLYDKIAKSINRDKDLSIDDMLKMEKDIRALDKERAESIQTEIGKIQNRMTSNLTAQFFVTTESEAYKKAAKANSDAVEAALEAFGNIQPSENNPFTQDTKFENLMSKIDKRLERTIGETSSTGNEDDEPGDTDVKSPGKPVRTPNAKGYDWVKHTDGLEYLYVDGEILEEGFWNDEYILNGRQGTGYSEETGFYYESGLLKTGISEETGLYYNNGVKGNGLYSVENSGNITEYQVKDGQIQFVQTKQADNLWKKEFFINNEVENEDGSTKVERILSRKETLSADKTKILSAVEYETDGSGNTKFTETYNYDDTKGEYTVTRKYTKTQVVETIRCDKYGNEFSAKGECLFNDVLYVDGEVATGEIVSGLNGKTYLNGRVKDGVYDETLWVDGNKYTGIFSNDGLYYKDGKVVPVAYDDKTQTLYLNGVPGSGVYKVDGTAKYYENGKALPNTSRAIVNFADTNELRNIKVTSENTFEMQIPYNNEMRTSTFTFGTATVKDAEGNDKEVPTLTQTTSYHYEVKYTNVYTLDDSGSAISGMIEAYVALGTGENITKVDLPLDNAKNDTTVDYSVMFADADGIIVDRKNSSETKGVQIAKAANDGMFILETYKKGADGKYALNKSELVLATINQWQSNRALYNSYVATPDKVGEADAYKVQLPDNSNQPHDVYFIHDENGKITGVKFGEKVITLAADQKLIMNYNNTVSIVTVDEDGNYSNMKTYEPDGNDNCNAPCEFTKDVIDLMSKLNLSLATVLAFTPETGEPTSITIKGVEYTITKSDETITLTGEDGVSELKYIKNAKEKYVLTHSVQKVNVSRNGNEITNYDIQTIEKDLSGQVLLNRLTDKGGYIKEEQEYANGIKVSETKRDKEGELNTTKEIFDARENTIKTIKTAYEKDAEGKTTIYEYNGKIELDEKGNIKNNLLSEEVLDADGELDSKTTYSYRTDNQIAKEEKLNADGTKEISIYNYTADGKDDGKDVTVYKKDGSIDKTRKYTKAYIFDYDEEDTPKRAYSETIGTETKYYDCNDVELSEAQLELQKSNNMNIIEIVYKDGSQDEMKGITLNGKQITYSDLTLSGTLYKSYTEKTLLAPNDITTDDDDVMLEKHVTPKGKTVTLSLLVLKEDGSSDRIYYNINANGAKDDRTIDNSIMSWEYDETAAKMLVADALTDDISRERIFVWDAEKKAYTAQEVFAIGKVEEVIAGKDVVKLSGIQPVPVISPDGKTIKYTLKPDNNIITAYYGTYSADTTDGHKQGEMIQAYTIDLSELNNSEEDADNSDNVLTFTITKDTDGKVTGTKITDKKGNEYTFEENKYIVKRSDGTVITYNADETYTEVFMIGDKKITLPNGASHSKPDENGNVTITRTADNTNGIFGLNLVYDKDGNLKKDSKLSFGDTDVELDANSELTYYGNYVIVTNGDETQVYDAKLNQIQIEDPTADKYKSLLNTVKDYLELSEKIENSKVDLASADIRIDNSKITIVEAGKATVVINLDSSNKINGFSIETTDTASGIPIKDNYNSKGEKTSRYITINQESIKVPDDAKVTKEDNGDIKVSGCKYNNHSYYEATYSSTGVNKSCCIKFSNGKTRNIPEGSTINVTGSENKTITAITKGTNYELRMSFDSDGNLASNTGAFYVKVGNVSHTFSAPLYENVVIANNRITFIMNNDGVLGESWIDLTNGNMPKNADGYWTGLGYGGEITVKSFFDKLKTEKPAATPATGNQQAADDDDDDEATAPEKVYVIKEETIISKYNELISEIGTAGNADFRRLLLYFVNLNSEGKAISIKEGLFKAIANNDDEITLDELKGKFSNSESTKITTALINAIATT